MWRPGHVPLLWAQQAPAAAGEGHWLNRRNQLRAWDEFWQLPLLGALTALPTPARRTPAAVVLGALTWAPECLLRCPEAVLQYSFVYSSLQNDQHYLKIPLLVLSRAVTGESFLKNAALCSRRADQNAPPAHRPRQLALLSRLNLKSFTPGSSPWPLGQLLICVP